MRINQELYIRLLEDRVTVLEAKQKYEEAVKRHEELEKQVSVRRQGAVVATLDNGRPQQSVPASDCKDPRTTKGGYDGE